MYVLLFYYQVPSKNGFFNFMIEKKETLAFRGSMPELVALLDAEWRNLSPEDKLRYKNHK
jgi:hypothetical protein